MENPRVQGQDMRRGQPRMQGGRAPANGNYRPQNPGQGRPRPQNIPSRPATAAERARTQTPGNRRRVREKKRIDPRTAEIRRRQAAQYKFRVREKRKSAIKLFFSRFLIFLVMFVLVFALTAAYMAISFFSYDKPDSDDIIYQIGGDDDTDRIRHTLDYNTVVRDGVVYINITEIALLCEFTTTGDLNEIKLICKNESNDNVKLTIDSPVVYINTQPVRMSAPTVRDGDDILIPIEFAHDYVLGLAAEYDPDNFKLVIMREQVGMTEATLTEPSAPIYADIRFKLKKPDTTPSITEDSLDEDIRIATEPKRSEA